MTPAFARPSKEELLANSSLLESKLADFDVEGKITHVNPGPVVTMYEFEPAPGVKINKVVSLADDLALSLKSQSLRVSPIHGKNTIGIEVPNKLQGDRLFQGDPLFRHLQKGPVETHPCPRQKYRR